MKTKKEIDTKIEELETMIDDFYYDIHELEDEIDRLKIERKKL